ncbi:FAD-binding oxidoreductase [Sandarakinorhabdus sp. DWP1-3-1]|uniref:FAD-binding oxidoreductase n=1 Tax=Sandarakinorhabdus sp. DWP1-3-1 TaxID=2804627 RepID=UPI003CFBA0ED
MATLLRTAPDLIDALAAAIGSDHVLTGDDDRRFAGTDCYRAGEIPVAVVRPGTVAELQAVVSACAAAGAAVTVRGGGASYTDGYIHSRPGGVTIDTVRLKAIAIDETNAVVTVEAGVTWADLYEALKPRGLRTPFWGPFSGLAATIAGSMSQHSVSHGTGVSAESLVAIEVVTGTGDLLATGGGAAFFRHFGPDLAGLFTGDCGALGVKARVTLRLTRRQPAFEAASFSFADFDALHAAMRLVGLENVLEENFALDATLQQGQLGRQAGVGAKAEIAASVMKSASSVASGMKSLARMAIAGDRDLKAASYVAHWSVEGVDAADARARIAVVKRIAAAHGSEIANTVPTVVRGMPFAPLTNVLGPRGERWVPVHTLLPHDRVPAFHGALQAYWAANRVDLDAHGIVNGGMFMTVNSGFLYEPTFYWPDARTIYHDRMAPADHLAGLPAYPANDAAAAAVDRLRTGVIAIMQAHGGVHFQIGKTYPYLETRDAASVALLRAIKAALDPRGILNLGALGL